jgi:hypothetical protein
VVRKDWIRNDETFTNPLEDEFAEDFEDRFQDVTKEDVFKVKDDAPANPYDRDGEFLMIVFCLLLPLASIFCLFSVVLFLFLLVGILAYSILFCIICSICCRLYTGFSCTHSLSQVAL